MTTVNTRSRIMDAFAGQLAENGYQSASLLSVARTVGIQKPSIYHHFPAGKEEIYSAVALRFIAQLSERIEAALQTGEGFKGTLIELGRTVANETQRSITFEQRIYDALDHVTEETRGVVSARYVAGVLEPVILRFTQAVSDREIAGDPSFLMDAFLQLARSTDSSGTQSPVESIVTLFLNGARPRTTPDVSSESDG